MQRIVKAEPFPPLLDFVQRSHTQNWEDLPYEIKNSSKEYILTIEQNGLSGYTEKPLKRYTHIDHYIKRDLKPQLTFDWNNLIVDEINDHYGARYKDNQIHHLNQYDAIFNPVIDSVENYFYYSKSGIIEPKSDLPNPLKEKAENTIQIFNLNHPDLVNKRQRIFKNIEDYQNQIENAIIFESLKSYGFHSLLKQELF